MMGNKEGCLLYKKNSSNQQSGTPEENFCIKKVASTSITHLLSILLEALLLKVLFFVALYLKIIVEHTTLRNNKCASYART